MSTPADLPEQAAEAAANNNAYAPPTDIPVVVPKQVPPVTATAPVAATGTGTVAATATEDVKEVPTDEAVMDYLRKKGMANAVLDLSKILKTTEPTIREKLELDEAESKTQRTVLARATGGGFGYDIDSGAQIPQWGVPDKSGASSKTMGMDEARAFVNSFVTLQTWVFGLPDSDSTRSLDPKTGISLKFMALGDNVPEQMHKLSKSVASIGPPSTKPELLCVTFSLLVHTYCELLEVGMETTAQSVLRTFRSVYEPHYNTELADLDKCQTTEDMVRLNSHNSSHLDALARLKAVMVQVANYQLKKDELSADNSANNANPQYASAKKRKLAEYDHNIALLNQKYEEVAKVATAAFEKMQDLPFLRRARAVRWQLTLSAASYTLLSSFLSSRESLLPMNTLLLKQCEIQVEHRDPLPYLPACVLDDNAMPSKKRARIEGDIKWAAPTQNRQLEAGEETKDAENLKNLPFPSYYLKEEYNSRKDGVRDKYKVEFNRALLMNGFRRLEALERKRGYEVGLRTGEPATMEDAAVNPLEPSILLSTLCASSSPGPHLAQGRSVDAAAIWEESGIGLTCAKLCPPDGRRVAAGCDDAAVRIWSVFDDKNEEGDKKKDGAVQEAAMVLLGHKNGFPVFDVSWNRDGRTLLSAGGDGSIRLWDTMAKGTFGSVTKMNQQKRKSLTSPSSTTMTTPAVTDEDTGMPVPRARPESNDDEANGAALAVYRGHSPQCPVWSVAFSPSGYYFASAGADGTARLWVTDRPTPVRIFSGHTSASVNTIAWHPNANYLATGCNDKTVRLWDIHTGRCVRLLNGCSEGINCVEISPSGRYAAGADYGGVIHLWDLGSGKKIKELRTDKQHTIHSLSYSNCGTALASGGDDCVVRIWDVRGAGTDQKSHLTTATTPTPMQVKKLHHAFPTRRTVLMDLQYNKRNLLLSVGKYTTPVPLVVPIGD